MFASMISFLFIFHVSNLHTHYFTSNLWSNAKPRMQNLPFFDNQYGTNSVLQRDEFAQPTSRFVSKTFKPMSLKHKVWRQIKKTPRVFFFPLVFFSRSNCSKCFLERIALHTWSVWTHQDKFQPPTFCFKYKNQTQKKTKKNKTKKLATVSGFLAAACLWHLCPSFERVCKLIAWRVWAKPQKTLKKIANSTSKKGTPDDNWQNSLIPLSLTWWTGLLRKFESSKNKFPARTRTLEGAPARWPAVTAIWGESCTHRLSEWW